MHRFISGIWILFHWSVCVFLCHPIKTYSFDHYPFEIRYCGVSSFVLLTRDDFCYLKCFMVPKTLCCCCSVTKSCPALCDPWTAARQAFLSFTISREFTQTHVHWVSDAIQPSHVLPPPSLALNLSSIRILSNEPAPHIKWAKYWSFSIISFQWIFRVDFLDVQGTIKNLLQHHSWLPLLFCNISLKCFCVLISQDSFVYSGLLWIFKVFCGSITNFRIVLFLW